MKARGPVWKIAVSTHREAEEAVTELLLRFFEVPVSSYTDVETGEVTVAVYVGQNPFVVPRLRGRLKAGLRTKVALRAGLKEIANCGLHTEPGTISIKKVRREDWAESWKRHFKPIEIGSALLIKPSWSKRPARKGQKVILLDPGLSFGTGQHPTTGFCLQQLASRAPRETQPGTRSLLDIGTGSGILAIAAAKLGYAPAEAFDFDREAVRIARENARKNGVLRKIHIARGDVTKLPLRAAKKYDLICANLISTLLVAEHRRILARLKPDGVLVIAGILSGEFSSVQRVYEGAGLRLIAGKTEKEWRSGAFQRRPDD